MSDELGVFGVATAKVQPLGAGASPQRVRRTSPTVLPSPKLESLNVVYPSNVSYLESGGSSVNRTQNSSFQPVRSSAEKHTARTGPINHQGSQGRLREPLMRSPHNQPILSGNIGPHLSLNNAWSPQPPMQPKLTEQQQRAHHIQMTLHKNQLRYSGAMKPFSSADVVGSHASAKPDRQLST